MLDMTTKAGRRSEFALGAMFKDGNENLHNAIQETGNNVVEDVRRAVREQPTP